MKSSSPYPCIAAEGFPPLRSKTAPGMARKYLQPIIMELKAKYEQRIEQAEAELRQVKNRNNLLLSGRINHYMSHYSGHFRSFSGIGEVSQPVVFPQRLAGNLHTGE